MSLQSVLLHSLSFRLDGPMNEVSHGLYVAVSRSMMDSAVDNSHDKFQET